MNSVVDSLNKLNQAIVIVSAAMIGILFAISVFLISNTINLAAHFRKRENEIMKLIGATNGMIRAPFVVEGSFIGLVGTIVPIGLMYVIYRHAEGYISEKLILSDSFNSLMDIISLIPFREILPVMLGVGAVLGVGMGFVVSFVTISKHLKV